MMNFRKSGALVLALLLCLTLALSACGNSGEDTTTPTTEQAANGYQVKVVDGLGNPCSGIIVRFLQNGTQVAMQIADENGLAVKELEDGEYTVELVYTDANMTGYYDQSNVTLTAESKSLEIVLYNMLSGESRSLFVGDSQYEAYSVSEGCTYVELTEGQRNYFLFTPTRSGTYEITMIGSSDPVGYYGAPHFVQETSTVEAVDNVITVSIKDSMIGTGDTGTTVMVLGVDASGKEGVLSVQRVGDPQWSVEDEPWTIYQTTGKLSAFTLKSGAKLQEFDLTASSDTYNLVYNEADGFYHLDSADGALVLVRLGTNPKYIDCFKNILDRSGVAKYFYNEDGSFLKKESYNECLLEYIAVMDEDSGLYPLTEDLKYIIQQRGDYAGWWGDDDTFNIFRDEAGNRVVDINADIAWLFMCCYTTDY